MNTHYCRATVSKAIGWLAITIPLVSFFAGLSLGDADFGKKKVAHLYFADAKQHFLIAEKRVMVYPGDPLSYERKLVEELIRGSINGNLDTIPTGTTLRSLFLLDDGTAVVDFSEHFRNNRPGGCRKEQLTLFSVVNSLILNIPEIDKVKILIEGEEARTLNGCITLENPLTADMLLTR